MSTRAWSRKRIASVGEGVVRSYGHARLLAAPEKAGQPGAPGLTCAAFTESSTSTGARTPPETLALMGRVTRHRGPDDEGVHADGPLRDRHAPPVDHRPRRRPPAAVERGRHAVAGRERRDLQLPGACAASCARRAIVSAPAPTARRCCTSTSSTATISCNALNGMFAFALWDARRRRLLARARSAGDQAALCLRTTAGA